MKYVLSSCNNGLRNMKWLYKEYYPQVYIYSFILALAGFTVTYAYAKVKKSFLCSKKWFSDKERRNRQKMVPMPYMWLV